MHSSSSVYFVNQPLHVSGIFVAHHLEVYCVYMYNSWYVFCFSVDCLLAGRPTDSQLKSGTDMTDILYEFVLMYSMQNIGYKKSRKVL